MKKQYIKPKTTLIVLDDEFMEGPAIHSGDGYNFNDDPINPGGAEGKGNDFEDDWGDLWSNYQYGNEGGHPDWGNID